MYKSLYYMLDHAGDAKPFSAASELELEVGDATAGRWIEDLEDLRDRRIAFQEEVTRGIWVSAAFMGVGHQGSDLTWHVSIFGGKLDGKELWSSTKNGAIEGAQKFVQEVREAEGLAKIDEFRQKRRGSSWAF